jgi:hypothetical protein
MKHGIGKMIMLDSNNAAEESSYEGAFFQNMFHGKGTFNFQKSSKKLRYTGSWHQNLMHGRGLLEWKSGKIYEGPFYMGKPAEKLRV